MAIQMRLFQYLFGFLIFSHSDEAQMCEGREFYNRFILTHIKKIPNPLKFQHELRLV